MNTTTLKDIKMSKPKEITDQNFDQEVLESQVPVLVDFWAPWCGPCHMIAPHLEELASELDGKVKILKLNVDENPQKAQAYQVMSIPNMKIFKGGEMVDNIVGAVPKSEISKRLTALI